MRDLENCVRVDSSQPSRQWSASKSYSDLSLLSTIDIARPAQTVPALESRLLQFAQKRAEAIVSLIVHKDDPVKSAEAREKITLSDDNFVRFVGMFSEILRENPRLVGDLGEKARIVQDTTIYCGLKERFFQLGRELGEAQGRNIDQERISRIQGIVSALEGRIGETLCCSKERVVPAQAERAPGDNTGSAMIIALRAAIGLGERVGIENRIAAEYDAAHIYRSIAGWKEYLPAWFPFFKPFHAVHSVLAGKSPEQIEFINKSLEESRGTGLREGLIKAYGEKFDARIRWLIEADEIGGAALSAARELGSFIGTRQSRGERLREIYERVPLKEIPCLEKLLARELNVAEQKLANYIASRVTLRAAQKLEVLRSSDYKPKERFLTEQAIHLADLLESKGSRLLQSRWVLRDLPREDLPQFSQIYERRHGQSLRSALEAKLPTSAAKDLCLAVVELDQERITAAEIKCAFSYRADWIGTPFLRISAEESVAKRASYCKVYHPELPGEQGFWQDLKQAAWVEDYSILAQLPLLCMALDKLWWPFTNSHPFLKSIVLKGELSRAERLRYFMVGIGTDTEGIYSDLDSLSNQEIAETTREYEARYSKGAFSQFIARIPVLREFFLIGKLHHDLRVELSGDHEFDISLLLEGLPSDSDERGLCRVKLDHLHRRYQHERSGVLLKNGLLNRWRGDATVLRSFVEDYHNAVSYYHEHIENQVTLDPEHIKRFCTLVRLAETQADAYRDAKVTLSGLVLNSGAAIGATVGAVGVLMCSSLPWWSAAVASGCGSLCWRWAQGSLLLGRGFGKTDATFQAIRAFIDGASMFTVRVGVATIGSFVGRQISSGVAKGGFKTSLNKFIQSIEDSIKRQDKARHLIEKGALMASDDQLVALTEDFYREIAADSSAVGSDKLTRGRKIEDVFLRALINS